MSQGLVMKPISYAADGFNNKKISDPILVGEEGAELVVPTGDGTISILDAATTRGLMHYPGYGDEQILTRTVGDSSPAYEQRKSEATRGPMSRRQHDKIVRGDILFPIKTETKDILPVRRPDSGPTIYNNPGNIEANKGFAGEIGSYANGRFAEFDTPQMGIRALALDLMTKIKRHDGSIDEIINQYAPDNENNTKVYQDFVKKYIGKDIVDTTDLQKFVEAIIIHENTPKIRDHYLANPNTIKEGIELASHQLPSNFMHEDAQKFSGKQKDEVKQLKPTLMGKPVKKAQEGMRNVDIGADMSSDNKQPAGFFFRNPLTPDKPSALEWLLGKIKNTDDEESSTDSEHTPPTYDAPSDTPPKEPFDPEKLKDETKSYGINLDYYYDNRDAMAEYSIKLRKGQDYVPSAEELNNEKEDLDTRFDAYWDMRKQQFKDEDIEDAKEQYMKRNKYMDDKKKNEELLKKYGPAILPTA